MDPYYEAHGITLFHGDCEAVLPGLPPADMIFTSPPYNLGVSSGGGFGHYNLGARGGSAKWHGNALTDGYDGHDDAMPYPEYEAWQHRVLLACWARLTERGAIFYNHKPRIQQGSLWLPLELNPGLPVRQIIIWARAGGMNFQPTAYVPTHEWVVVMAKEAWRLKSKAASGAGDVWRFAQQPSDHPAPFPVELPARAIETAAPRSVIDPFCGSGTTLLAAQRAGVPAIGIEKSEKYCEQAAERLGRAPAFSEDSLFG